MRCSYCHQRDHNKRTCSVLTKRLKERHDTDIEAGHTNTWAIQQYKDRIAPKGKKVSSQQCGYCGDYGHTRRKCEVLQKDKEWFVVHHNVNLRVAHDYIVQSPVGIGSLFRLKEQLYNYNTGEYDTSHEMLVLTGFSVPPIIKQDGFKIFATLQHPTTGLTLASANKLEYFKRVGRKNEDRRGYAFSILHRTRELIEKYPSSADDPYDHHGRAKAELAQYTPEHNRVKLFEDFKSGE